MERNRMKTRERRHKAKSYQMKMLAAICGHSLESQGLIEQKV